MFVFTLTENDYAEIKALSLESLKEYLKNVIRDLKALIIVFERSPTSDLNDQINEATLWQTAYQAEIDIRTVITTPVCRGCKDGVLNQEGHYGGCLEEPGFDIFPY